ncbi:MAG: S8 family peptidase [Clostridiales bacterium]|nr:S8 family peptidase [Clostridiales bacterium]
MNYNGNQFFDLSEIYSRGITGKGITAAVLDTGIYSHRDFMIPVCRICYFRDFVNGKREPYDDNGHGTHVSGIIASAGRRSDGRLIGIAPEASIMALKVLDRDGRGQVRTMVRAIDWILKHYKDRDIRIVNISVGMPVENQENPQKDLLVQKVEELWNHGLVVVVAAGNEGPGQYTVTSPGVSRKVITVGALEQGAVYHGRFVRGIHYSCCGPVPGTCGCKADIVAPATFVLSCDHHENAYKRRSGTSMAAPVVTGVIALLLSAQPWLTNLDVKMRLMETGIDCGVPKNRQGWGAINPAGLFYGR